MYRTWNIQRIIYSFKCSQVLNRIILIKSFLSGVLYDCFKVIYTYLNEGDKVCVCYSCLKMVIQAHLHFGFFTIFFIKHTSHKQFYLYLELLKSSIFFKQKKQKKKKKIISVLRLKFLHDFLQFPIQKMSLQLYAKLQ